MTASPPELVIPDLDTGINLIAQLPLANPPEALEQINRLLDGLKAMPPSPEIYLALLEQARVPLCFVAEELARTYHNKPLPLAELEEFRFLRVVETWRKMGRAYNQCAQGVHADPKDPNYANYVAGILHRNLYYTGAIIHEHYRARQELPRGIWLDLHGYYETAEELGVATEPVVDPLEGEQHTTHCAATYITLLLIEIASPYSHSVRDQNLIRRWAYLWAPLVAVLPVDSDLEVPPFVVDLMQDKALHPATNGMVADSARRLDTSRLAIQIAQIQAQLKQRMLPSQLGLGEETNNHARKLLDKLSGPWTQTSIPRRFRRYAASGRVKVCCGFESMHLAISGDVFTQPEASRAYSRKDFEDMATFRYMVEPEKMLHIRQCNLDFPVDQWEVINHSANGFRLGRSMAGQKMAHSQLLALCPHDGEHYLLGEASWLMQETSEGSLVLGVSVLPGMPKAVAVRSNDSAKGNGEHYVRAFMLPGVEAINAPPALVLPTGLYRAERSMSLFCDGKLHNVTIKSILQRGMDFDRVSFVQEN